MNGTGPHEGRVEICYSGLWKSACDYWWTNSDAKVICSQLHYPPQGASIGIIMHTEVR